MLLEDIVLKISDHLEELFDRPAIHVPDTYENILNSKASSTWGWTKPLVVDGFNVVYHQLSPPKAGGYSYIAFDFQEAH